jgi:hypothetical protein
MMYGQFEEQDTMTTTWPRLRAQHDALMVGQDLFAAFKHALRAEVPGNVVPPLMIPGCILKTTCFFLLIIIRPLIAAPMNAQINAGDLLDDVVCCQLSL